MNDTHNTILNSCQFFTGINTKCHCDTWSGRQVFKKFGRVQGQARQDPRRRHASADGTFYFDKMKTIMATSMWQQQLTGSVTDAKLYLWFH